MVIYRHGYCDTKLHHDAIAICGKYKMLFSKYGKCHQLLNGCGEFDNDKIETLSK